MKNGKKLAFACVDSQKQYLQEGLTKREYFAAMVDLPLKIIVDMKKSTPDKIKFTTEEGKFRSICYDQYTSIDTNTNKLSIQYKSKGGFILKNHVIIKAIKYYEKKRLEI